MQASENPLSAKKISPDDIQALFKDELEAVEKSIKENFQSSVTMIPLISEYLTMGGGKRLRPMLVLATSKLSGYKGGNGNIIHSTVVEYIHAATLLHDDVVDSAGLRRGIQSANAKWGNEYSVLVGDFLFAKSFSLMAEHSPLAIVQAVSEASRHLAEGEILQLVHTTDLELTEEKYIDLVFRKTGALIKASCQIGGLLGGLSGEKLRALEKYGRNVGIAFQIIDDLLDFTADEKRLGKPVGQDLIEGHITLPVIHAYKKATGEEREFFRETVKDEELTRLKMGKVIELIKKYDSISYGNRIAGEYTEKAISELDCFPPSRELDVLKVLAEYIVNRDM